MCLVQGTSVDTSYAKKSELESVAPVSSVSGIGGMVTADNQTASEVGVEILRKGGDAADAAVATALMLGVLQPYASGIGGGGFAVVYRKDAGDDQTFALDFREVAPQKSVPDMYLDQAKNVIPQRSTKGALAVAVPGEIAGLFELHKRYGKLPWSQLVAPALRAAKDGFPMHPALYAQIQSKKVDLLKLEHYQKSFFRNDGTIKQVGELIQLPHLANTLQAIAQHGRAGFYKGKVGETLVQAVQSAGGIITQADLASYQPKQRKVLRGTYRGFELHTMPPPSSGGVVILQVLQTLERLKYHTFAFDDAGAYHRLIEALKHAFADRASSLGDPDFGAPSILPLLSDQRISEIVRLFDATQTLSPEKYGALIQAPKDGGTSHFNVIDKQGNSIALTTTINTSFGSKFIAGDTGVLLNNEMDDFVAKAGVPNAYGLLGQASNQIQAGKRPLSSMSPTLIFKDHELIGMVGGSGGPTIITGTLQVLLRLLLSDIPSPDQAVRAARIHHQWMPNLLFVDPDFPEKDRQSLTAFGHKVKPWTKRFNAIQALWKYADGCIEGASDPSKQGVPATVETKKCLTQVRVQKNVTCSKNCKKK